MPNPSPFEMEHIGDVTVVRFFGKKCIDKSNVSEIGEELFRLVDELGARKLLLNFRDVEYLSSAALGKFIALKKKVKAAGGRIVLCHLDPRVHEIFEITKLNKLFGFYRDEDDGLTGIGARLKPPKPSDPNSAALRLPESES